MTDLTPPLLNPGVLVYPTAIQGHQYSNVLLIDRSVQEYQQFIDAANTDTFPIVYSIMSSKTDLLALLKTTFTSISRLGLVFHSSSGDAITFLDREPLFVADEVNANQQFIKDVINEFQIKNIDYLACNTLNYPNWTNYYDSISQDTGVVVGASNDKTGNIKYGGDWVLESTSENVELIYFTQSIEYYQYLLLTFADNGINYTITTTTTCSFSYTPGLSGAITIPSTVINNGNTYTVTSIGDYAFYMSNSIFTSIAMPNSVTSIGNFAFSSSFDLTTITMPNVTTIGEGAFQYCSRLKTISMPNVTTIGSYAFASCSALTSIVIPGGVTTIGSYAFASCSALTSVIFNDQRNLTSTGQYIFANCPITSFTYYNTSGFGDLKNASKSILTAFPGSPSITYVSPLTISSVSPDSGPLGGTSVTITGTGFVSGVTSVTFGGVNATSVSVTSTTSITCSAPAGTVGPANVVVTTPGGSATNAFTYITPPTITNISPSLGPLGGTSVTITGTGFVSGVTSVTFGGVNATSVSVTSTSINCTAPAGTAGSANVVVTTPGGTTTANSNSVFTYVSPPTISSVSPVSGPLGGTTVTIRGTNFTGATSVTFEGVPATSFNVDTVTTITCTAPAGTAGSANVVVTTPGGVTTPDLNSVFTYTLEPLSNICFPAGTPITSNQGSISIEQLNPEIHTIRGKKIVGITKTVTQDKYLVCFEKDALQENIPSQKTVISKNHGIFYKGEMMQAKDFINDFANVKKVKYTGEVLYNVLMEQPDKMMVNNLICETLHPENTIAQLYKALSNLNTEQQNEVIAKFNQCVIENNIYKKDKSKKSI